MRFPKLAPVSTHFLSRDLAELRNQTATTGFSLGEVVGAFGDRGYGLLLVILALPSAMPLPAPGYSTPFGIALLLVGAQMLAGKRVPWLPQRVLRRRVTPKTGDRMLGYGMRFFGKVEHLVSPRLPWLFKRGWLSFISLLLLAMAALMTLPIPLTNTVPAIAVFLLGIGLVEKDGFVVLAACVAAAAAALLYALAFWAIFHFGLQGMEEVKEVVREYLRG